MSKFTLPLHDLRSSSLALPKKLSILDENIFDIAYTVVSMKGATQKLEFLAKRLLVGEEPSKKRELFGKVEKQVLLGSPIYVSLVE